MSAALRRIAFGMALAIFGIASWLMRGDGSPPDDSDLLVMAAPIADHENGYVSWLAAGELLQWPEDEARAARLRAMAQGEVWDDALAVRALAANELALHTFARVARSRSFQSPGGSRPSHEALDAIELSRLLAIRAMAAARRGESEAALEDALLLVRTGSKLGANGNGGLLYSELAFTVGELGLRAIDAISPSLALTPARTVALTRALLAERAAPAHWRAALATEYRAERALLARSPPPLGDGPAASVAAWLPSRYLFQPNRTLAELSANVRLQQARADQPCVPIAAELPPLSFSDLLRPNALGRRAAAAPSARERVEIARCHYDARLELTRAALGVLSFERARGATPPALSALVPIHLDSLAADPFSTGALRLDRKRRVIYSVGSDGLDEGGREVPASEAAREPRLALPVLAPG